MPDVLLDQWLSEIISLFDGCVYDVPEKPMPASNTSTGGQVEYEMFIWERAMVLLIEVKHHLVEGESYWNHLAQVMCELDCTWSPTLFSPFGRLINEYIVIAAYQMNCRIDLKDFPIYAILTDGIRWHFLHTMAQRRSFMRMK